MVDYSYYRKLLIKAGALLLITTPVVQAADLQGLWKFKGGDNIMTADWVIGVSNGFIYGSSFWFRDGKPNGEINDKLEGSVNGNTIVITRSLSGVNAGKSQTLKATVGTDGTISGTWSGTGCSSSCSWTATVIPLSTATVTTSATYNPSTGRLVIPNLAVPVTPLFSTTAQIVNYSVEMQQRTGSFAFDLDLSTVKQK